MKRGFVFHEGELPPDYRYAFEAAIFNTAAFRKLQSNSGWASFYILDPKTLSVHGDLHFHVANGIAQTPLRAPFGSVEVSPVLLADTLYDFLEFAELKLVRAGVSEIVVKNSPDAYDPQKAALLNAFFFTRGYSTLAADLGSVLPVSVKPFDALLNAGKRWKLKRSHAFSPRFALLNSDSWRAVFDFISACRQRKQYDLSITGDQLKQAIDQFPGAYKNFGVYAGDTLVAASTVVHISQGILYHFISDHIRDTGSFSPGLVLMEGIYRYCQENGIAILDLGTSVVDATPKFKLFNFKRELGAKPTVKFTFRKILSS